MEKKLEVKAHFCNRKCCEDMPDSYEEMVIKENSFSEE